MGLLSNVDKEKIKRALPKTSNKIIDVAIARLYIAYPNPDEWNYTGLWGAIVLVDDIVGCTFFLKLVDIQGHQGVLWDQELYVGFDYNQDRSFFHSFELEDCYAGLLFEDLNDAAHFLKRVQKREKYGSKKTISNKNAFALTDKLNEKNANQIKGGPRGVAAVSAQRGRYSLSIKRGEENLSPVTMKKKAPPPPPKTEQDHGRMESEIPTEASRISLVSGFSSVRKHMSPASSPQAESSICTQPPQQSLAHVQTSPITPVVSEQHDNLTLTSDAPTQHRHQKYQQPPTPPAPFPFQQALPLSEKNEQPASDTPSSTLASGKGPAQHYGVLPNHCELASLYSPPNHLSKTNSAFIAGRDLPDTGIPERGGGAPLAPAGASAPSPPPRRGGTCPSSANATKPSSLKTAVVATGRRGPLPPPRRGTAPLKPVKGNGTSIPLSVQPQQNETYNYQKTVPPPYPQQSTGIKQPALSPPHQSAQTGGTIGDESQMSTLPPTVRPRYEVSQQSAYSLDSQQKAMPALQVQNVQPQYRIPACPPSSYFSAIQPGNEGSFKQSSGDNSRDNLLASIREAGGISSLRKINKSQLEKKSVLLNETHAEASQHKMNASGAGTSISLSNALAAALHKRKTKLGRDGDEHNDDW